MEGTEVRDPGTNTCIQQSDERGFRVSRRAFLAGGAAVAAVAAVAACAPKTPTTTTTTTPPAPAPETFIFFNDREASAIKAAFAQLLPGTAQDPGAVEAGAHIYLDRALAGAYSNLQATYRRGIAAMNAYSNSKYGKDFTGLTPAQQVQVLTDMQQGKATGFYAPGAASFFGTLLQHTREGTFSDPIYGGNVGTAGWKMVGFPGAQVTYSDTDMAVGADQSKKKILTLADSEDIPMPAPQSGF